MTPRITERGLALAAASLASVPYLDGGRDKDGLDCFGLVRLLLAGCGVDLPDYATPPREDQAESFVSNYHRHAEEVGRERARAGDVVFFERGGAAHVGLMLSAHRFVHMSRDSGVQFLPVSRLAGRMRFYRVRTEVPANV